MPASRRNRTFILSLASLLTLLAVLSAPARADPLLDQCLSDPSKEKCRDAVYPDDRVNTDMTSLCSAMHFMPGCSVKTFCSGPSTPFAHPRLCAPFTALATVCAKDMPRMRGCGSFNALCGRNSTVLQCSDAVSTALRIPTTAQARDGIFSICNEMDMDGCELCPKLPGRSFPDCDLLAVYSKLCVDMPGMTQCRDFGWASMCADPELSKSEFCSGAPIADEARGPVMRMYFHWSLADYILFRPWVPRTWWQYASALALVFLASLGYQMLDIMATNVIPKLTGSGIELPVEGNGNAPATSQRKVDLARAALVAFMKLYGYALMLIAMTFNIGLVIAVVSGFGVGEYLFGSRRQLGVPWEGESRCC